MGRLPVISLVLWIPRVVGVIDYPFAHPQEALLDVLWERELGLLGFLSVCKQRREAVADLTLGAVPFALGGILWIQGGIQAREMIGVWTGLAADQVASLATLMTLIAVVGGITVRFHVSKCSRR